MLSSSYVVVSVKAGVIDAVEPFSSRDAAVARKAQFLRTCDLAEDDVGVFELAAKEVMP